MSVTTPMPDHWTLCRTFGHHSPIVATTFHESGDLFAVSTADSTLSLYNIVAGSKVLYTYIKNSPVSNLCYTKHPEAVLYSRATDFSIKLLCFHDNTVIRTWSEGTSPTVSLSMQPKTESFIATYTNGDMKIFDSRDGKPQLSTRFPFPSPYICQDREGLVFACVAGSSLSLYDSRLFSGQPFATYSLPTGKYVKAEFSPNSQFLAITSASSAYYYVDSYSGAIKRGFRSTPEGAVLPPNVASGEVVLPCTFLPSPTKNLFACGSIRGDLFLYDLDTGLHSVTLKSGSSVITGLTASPTKQCLVSYDDTGKMFLFVA
ncbi:hypothetical protein RCL1_002288 [Eukaryota sp. TZLM3-RCL]